MRTTPSTSHAKAALRSASIQLSRQQGSNISSSHRNLALLLPHACKLIPPAVDWLRCRTQLLQEMWAAAVRQGSGCHLYGRFCRWRLRYIYCVARLPRHPPDSIDTLILASDVKGYGLLEKRPAFENLRVFEQCCASPICAYVCSLRSA